jgi:hypothetical protein
LARFFFKKKSAKILFPYWQIHVRDVLIEKQVGTVWVNTATGDLGIIIRDSD